MTNLEQQLDEVIATYLEAVESGRPPDRKALLAKHPEIAAELSSFFADQDQFDEIVCPVTPMSVAALAYPSPSSFPKELLPPPPAIGQRFGDYELVEEIARGGMGIVFRARHLKLQRVVALKMIVSGQLATDEQVQRFHLETESVARLDHPGIVPIYEVGQLDGWHFFTMKLIEGGPLDPRGWDYHGPQGQRRGAERMSAVARAIHHAHQRGVLHRDLKPANILIDLQGKAFVTDFGLAKKIHELVPVSNTPSGATVGTPSYMAPEQATGPRNITTAVDTYSLGAILYEILTGQPPYRAETPLATMLEVIDGRLIKPSMLRAGIHPDLENICLKCLEKDAAARYATAGELADDLDRYLRGEPVRARPASLGRRLARWARREPIRASLVAALFLVTATAMGVIVWQWRQAEQNFELAERRLDQAQNVVDELCMRLSQERLSQYPALAQLRKEVLKSSLRYYREFLADRGNDKTLRFQTARTHQTLGSLLSATDSRAEALHELKQAQAIYDELLADEPGNMEVQKAVASTLKRMAHLQSDLGHPQAQKSFETALKGWDDLAKKHPDHPAFLVEKAGVLRSMSDLHRRQGDLQKAGDLLVEALALLERTQPLFTDQPHFQADLVETYFSRGNLLAIAGKGPEGLTFLRKGQAILEGLIHKQPDNLTWQSLMGVTLCNIGIEELLQGVYPAAQASLSRARDLQEKLVQVSPGVPFHQRDLAYTYRQIGHGNFHQKKAKEAHDFYRKAQELMEKVVQLQPDSNEYHHELGRAHIDVGTSLAAQGRFSEAFESSSKARDEIKQAVDSNPGNMVFRQDLARAYQQLAQVLCDQSRREESRAYWDKAEEQLLDMRKLAPQVPRYREQLADHYVKRLAGELIDGRIGEVDRLLEARLSLGNANGAEAFTFAQTMVQLIGIAKEHERKNQFADLAVAALRQAVDLGYRDLPKVETLAGTQALRLRPEYASLIVTLKSKR